MSQGEYKNILVHSLVNIGDVLLTTGALALLREACPGARVTMMVRPNAAELVTDHPWVDEVLVYDYKNTHRSPGGQLAFLRELRQRRFDLVISFDRKLRPAILAVLAGIPRRVTADRIFDNKPGLVTKLYTDIIDIPYDVSTKLQRETYQEIVRRFFGKTGAAQPALGRLHEVHYAAADSLLARLPSGKPRIGLCVKGTFALKNWPQERFARLMEALEKETDAAFFVTGAPEDKAYADEMIATSTVKAANFCGATGLKELAALLERTHLFITVDTGAAHIAATTGVPMVVLYGCTSPQRWAPANSRAAVISRDPECCPCAVAEDGCDMARCLLDIKVEEVLEAALRILR